jgi:transglutaminase/protease-like cytokinesis protein 3
VLIFSYWIAKNIKYDLSEVKDQGRTNKTPYEVLRNKKAVCEGYSILFQQFCENEGIEAYTVYGHGYGNLIRRSLNLYHLRHAWNAVYVNGKWQILDVTWAASEVKHGDFKKTHQFKWIFPEPDEFAKTHYPNDPRWQLLKNPRSKREFWNQSDRQYLKKTMPLTTRSTYSLKRARYLNELAICASALCRAAAMNRLILKP